MHNDFSAHITASRTCERARDGLIASGADVGPFVSVPYTGDRVAAYRDGARVRLEIVYADGSYSQHTFGGASRQLAGAIARLR